jgi:uncharacterized membrane protein YcaP (DUF421 family)
MLRLEEFFPGWEALCRIGIHMVFGYVVLLFLVRRFGQRSLSRTNTFDLILTVAIGAIFGGAAFNPNITIIEIAYTIFIVIFVQYAVTKLRLKFPQFGKWVASKPVLLYSDGRVHTDRLKHEQISNEDLAMAARQHGLRDIKAADEIWLEGNGEFSVIRKE